MLRIRTQPSLSRDFALLSLLILLILMVVSAWITIETLANQAEALNKRMENEALRIDRALIVETENASYLLESLGRQIQATGLGNEEAISQLFFSFAKSEGPKRSIFSWINNEQQLTVSSNMGVLAKPIDVSDRDYVKKSITEPWKVHIGRPILGRLSQRWVLPLSLGLTDAKGTYAGSVIIALDTSKLTDDIARVIKDNGIRFAITNLALTLITQTSSAEKFFADTFDMNALSRIDFSTANSGTYSRGSAIDDAKRFAYYERSSQYPFIIFVGITPEYTKNSVRSVLMPRLFQLLIIALFLLFVLWTVRRRIIQPVIQLTTHSSSILRGDRFDPEALQGPLEIEQLAYEIKRLYDYIEERRRVESELRLKNAELNRIKEAAQLTNQVKAEFFAYVGEELTEPVETILEQIETIKDQHFGPLNNPKYLQHAREVHEHAQRLFEMLADIKAISEAETGLLALSESEVDLNFVLQKAIRIFRDKNPNAADMQPELNPSLPRLRGDELRLKQLVLNILQAIAQQLSTSDVIRISTSVKGREVMLVFAYVSAPVDAGRLKSFSPMAFTARGKHGLELALARLLVAMHQGVLEMKTTQDRTTTITVRFPESRII